MKIAHQPNITNSSHIVPDQIHIKKDEKLLKVVQEFQSILIYNMLKSMRATIPRSELTEESPGKDYFMSLFDEQLAITIAKQQNDSLSEVLYRQLSEEKIFPTSKFIAPAIKNTGYLHHNKFNRLAQYRAIIQEASAKYGIDEKLISAVILQESGGDPAAKSAKGARGLMQLMEETARDMGVQNVMDPKDNIFGGTKYLQKLLDKHNGDISLTLASYNAGPAAVEKYDGIPPYPETQQYVDRVLTFYENLKK